MAYRLIILATVANVKPPKKSEVEIMRAIQVEASTLGDRLFRNNVGQGWVGKIISRTKDTITIQNPRPLNAGLCTGSSDLIGWTLVKITPDMLNQTVAIFTAVETKSLKGTLKPEQTSFLEAVRNAGGIAVVARSVDDYLRGIQSCADRNRTENHD